MGYAEFGALLKKINLKPKGVKEIVLEISDGALAGKIDMLSEMIDSKITVAVESEVVRYNVEINARTDKPIKTYRVDDKGVVGEVKPEGEQLSMDLGLPPEKLEIKQQPAEIDLAVIEEFIQSGLAPSFEDLDYDFVSFSNRLSGGDTYMKLASELGISSGKIVEIIDEYRKRIAPLAAKWDEWRKGQAPAESAETGSAPDPEDKQDGSDLKDDGEGNGLEVESSGESTQGESGESSKGDPADPAAEVDVSKDALEAFILEDRPLFDDIEFNGQPIEFPALLEVRLKENKTWKEIAESNGMDRGQLAAKWNVYKKRAAKKMQEGGGAA
ncbi:hypothetical protein [Paenibacillus apii]|uniref:hypothetical protein n=1 Tax=Paenibacillus apii TaxID=1850370 RepID=UPI00198105C4|nr:hypothetical protein [Paenibacillus apii]